MIDLPAPASSCRPVRRCLWPSTLLLLFSSAAAHADWTLGMGVGGMTDAYISDKDTVSPMPIIAFDGELVSATLGAAVNLHVARSEWLRIDLLANLRTSAIDDPFTRKQDEPAFAGMERDYAIDIGAGFVFPLAAPVTLEWRADQSGHDGGDLASVTVAVPLIDDERLSASVTIAAQWLSADYVNYNYGVSAREARFDRPAYRAKSTWTSVADVELIYRLNASWFIASGVGIERLSNEITASPLVEDSEVISARAGLMFSF